MNPVSESRFLPSFFAVAASLVLVFGGIVLLTSTAPWTPRANDRAVDGQFRVLRGRGRGADKD